MSIDQDLAPAADAADAAASTAPPKCAWATLLTSEHLLPGVVVFAHSLLVQHKSRFPLVIMATSTLSARARTMLTNMLASSRIIVRDISPIYPTSTATGLAYTRFNEVWTKLRAFELTEYDRVGLVDSDMLVLENMDELFSEEHVFGLGRNEGEEWIGASWACTCNPNRIATYPADWTPSNCGFTRQSLPEAASISSVVQPSESTARPARPINSGLVMLTPSSSTMSEMIQRINTDAQIAHYRFPDQDFLADFFTRSNGNRHIRYLPYIYNALKKLRSVHTNIWSDTHAKNVHYILDKPWTLGRPATKSNVDAKDPDAEIHAWWWNVFDQLKSSIHQPNKGTIRLSQIDWKECVEKYMTMD